MELQQTLEQLCVQVVGFLVLFVVLRKIGWVPLMRLLDERRAHIESQLSQVAQSREELGRLQADYSRRLAQIDEEARVKIQQAILEGKRISLEVQEQARAQASAILTKSKETIELEFAKAQVTLRDHVADMTVDAVERVLQKKLDAKTDRQLVEATLQELERERARA